MKKDNIIITVCDAEYSNSREEDPVFNVNLRIIGTEFYKQIHTNNKFGCPSPMLHKVRSALLSQLFPDVKKVIFNNPATIVFWSDGTKTVVKCHEGDEFDQEKGLALCFMKKIYGNTGYFNNVLKKYVTEEKDDDTFTNFSNGFAKLTESLNNLASSMSLFGTGNDLNKSIGEKCIPIDKDFSKYDFTYMTLVDISWNSIKTLLQFFDIDCNKYGINEYNYANLNLYSKDKIDRNKYLILDILFSKSIDEPILYIVKNLSLDKCKIYSEKDFYENFKVEVPEI